MLFVYTSSLMFVLRFFAGPIVERTSPLGLLFVSGILGAIGLTLLGNATSVAVLRPRRDRLCPAARRSSGRRCWPSSPSSSPRGRHHHRRDRRRGHALGRPAGRAGHRLRAGPLRLRGPQAGRPRRLRALQGRRTRTSSWPSRPSASTAPRSASSRTSGKEADPRHSEGPQEGLPRRRPEAIARPAEARRLVGRRQGDRREPTSTS